MKKMTLSLTPIKEGRWELHEPTGIRLKIAALSAVVDSQLSREAEDSAGRVDGMKFAQLVAPKVILDWENVRSGDTPAPCTPENIERFVAAHGQRLMPWVIARARSVDHYREEETEAAKKD